MNGIEATKKELSLYTLETRETEEVLDHMGIKKEDLKDHQSIEVWGDKFAGKGGTDSGMSKALPHEVRSIDFRSEDSAEFPPDHNIVLWNG